MLIVPPSLLDHFDREKAGTNRAREGGLDVVP